jgi:hypothetical protein
MLCFLNVYMPLVTKYILRTKITDFLNTSLVSMGIILEVEVLLNEDAEPVGRGEAQHGHGHNHGSLNGRRD